ncbi:MAG: metal-dependent transcriptional regulator [Anaerolineae bacterium]|nr:metal-dependent transcriptional regulator [Anaerolineae bacterium]
MSISTAMQEYLAEAYRLAYYNDAEPYVSTAALADVMHVSAPAVTRMVQRLKDAGYVEHEPYKGIYLTPDGEHEALMSIRRHRLVERFLVDVMSFGWHEVHDTADELGVVVSDHVVNRMEKIAGFPRRCPHGEPIPTAGGFMPRVKDYPLSEIHLEPERELVISRVATHDDKKLHYLDTLGLKPGVRFNLISRAPFKGPLQLKFGDEVQVIGHELAGVLRVCSEQEFALV